MTDKQQAPTRHAQGTAKRIPGGLMASQRCGDAAAVQAAEAKPLRDQERPRTADDLVNLLHVLGFTLRPTGTSLTIVTNGEESIVVTIDQADGAKSTINYGPHIKVHHAGVKSFRQPESLVVLACVVTLLKRGYSPRRIELEKTWPLGRDASGRLNIMLRDPRGNSYAIIECQTPGKEYTKARNRTLEDGGQLLSYFQQERATKALYLYCSRIEDGQMVELAEFIRCDALTGANVEELHASWGGTLEPSGIFHRSAGLYDDEFRGITKKQLKNLTRDTGQGVFHSFAEILRRHVVSDKPNAFNKIFNLFLCKIADEDEKSDDQEMDLQWRFGDTGEALLARLTRLYRSGLSEYLRLETEKEYHSPLTEFAFVDVFDKKTFDHNIMVLREVVELLQNYRVKYSARHQYLGDFFEMLLSTGVKQEAGQFFTPVPLARAVIRALPIRRIIDAKIAAGRAEILPFIVDYACGAGHFLTEAIEEVHRVSEGVDPNKLSGRAKSKFTRGRDAYGWASECVFGIEKDHRLAKVAKIATFLNGDGDANIIHGDGLAAFSEASGYPQLLVSRNQHRLGKLDIVVSNPPFSVDNFRRDVQQGANRFRLYKHLSADSGEIECLFLERASQMLVDGGCAAIFFPLSILSNGHAVYRAARRLLAIDFEVCGLIELRNKTFIATPTTTVCCFLKRRGAADVEASAGRLLKLAADVREKLTSGGIDPELVREAVAALANKTAAGIVEAAYDSDTLAHAIRLIADGGLETIIAFSGDSVQEQQRALGYRFSRSRGSEGCPVFKENGVPQTLLYDPGSLENQGRFSGAVLARFERRPVDIPAGDEEIVRFMLAVSSSDIWKIRDGSIENPSAFFVSETSVESASPFGDFIDAMDGVDQSIGDWLDEGRCILVRGAIYPKEIETPRVAATRILTASNLNINTRQITLQQYRYLSSNEHVAEEQRPTPGDIVICTASGSLKHLGKIAVAREAVDAYIGGFLTILRCPAPVDRKIIENNLLSARFRQLIAKAKEQNISNLTEAKLRSFSLHVPTNGKAFIAEVQRRESGAL